MKKYSGKELKEELNRCEHNTCGYDIKFLKVQTKNIGDDCKKVKFSFKYDEKIYKGVIIVESYVFISRPHIVESKISKEAFYLIAKDFLKYDKFNVEREYFSINGLYIKRVEWRGVKWNLAQLQRLYNVVKLEENKFGVNVKLISNVFNNISGV
jgi:hypothetical protein